MRGGRRLSKTEFPEINLQEDEEEQSVRNQEQDTPAAASSKLASKQASATLIVPGTESAARASSPTDSYQNVGGAPSCTESEAEDDVAVDADGDGDSDVGFMLPASVLRESSRRQPKAAPPHVAVKPKPMAKPANAAGVGSGTVKNAAPPTVAPKPKTRGKAPPPPVAAKPSKAACPPQVAVTVAVAAEPVFAAQLDVGQSQKEAVDSDLDDEVSGWKSAGDNCREYHLAPASECRNQIECEGV